MKNLTDLFRCMTAFFLFVSLWACEKKPETGNQNISTDKIDTPIESDGRSPGKYCFEFKDETISIRGELKLSENKNVEGILNGIRIDINTKSTTPFEILFKGHLEDQNLILKTTGDEFGSTLEQQQTWRWYGDELIENDHSLREVSCG